MGLKLQRSIFLIHSLTPPPPIFSKKVKIFSNTIVSHITPPSVCLSVSFSVFMIASYKIFVPFHMIVSHINSPISIFLCVLYHFDMVVSHIRPQPTDSMSGFLCHFNMIVSYLTECLFEFLYHFNMIVSHT